MPLVPTTFQNRPSKHTYYKRVIDMYFLMVENGNSKIEHTKHTYYKIIIDMCISNVQKWKIKISTRVSASARTNKYVKQITKKEN